MLHTQAGHFTRGRLHTQMTGSRGSPFTQRLSTEVPVLCSPALSESCVSKKKIIHQCWSMLISGRALGSLSPGVRRASPLGSARDQCQGGAQGLLASFMVLKVRARLLSGPVLFSFLFSILLLLVPPPFLFPKQTQYLNHDEPGIAH